MSRAHIWQIVFVLLMIVGCIGMGLNLFAGHNPDAVSAWAVVFGAGLVGQLIAALLRLRK